MCYIALYRPIPTAVGNGGSVSGKLLLFGLCLDYYCCFVIDQRLVVTNQKAAVMIHMQVYKQQLNTCGSTSNHKQQCGGAMHCYETCSRSGQTVHLTARETTREDAVHRW